MKGNLQLTEYCTVIENGNLRLKETCNWEGTFLRFFCFSIQGDNYKNVQNVSEYLRIKLVLKYTFFVKTQQQINK